MTNKTSELVASISFKAVVVLALLLLLASLFGVTHDAKNMCTIAHRFGYTVHEMSSIHAESHCPLLATNRVSGVFDDGDQLWEGTLCYSTWIGHDTVIVLTPQREIFP